MAVEPLRYLAEIITRIVNSHRQSRLDELLPWIYSTTPPQGRGLRTALTGGKCPRHKHRQCGFGDGY
ncbi:transposase domain-containing protein [Reyranella sp.]|uniref:transposase domain-containing protein n=1 Tax=Reyranella sp. TaxID=1929291 RepID=UPI004035C579